MPKPTMIETKTLEAQFRAAFIDPWHREWASGLGRTILIETEQHFDALAGPVSAIVAKGSAEYAYERDDHYFATVNDPEGLNTMLRIWHVQLLEGIRSFTTRSKAQQADLDALLAIAEEARAVTEAACEI